MLTASRFLDPKSDIVFKKIFGSHPHLLISFLNSIMPIPCPITKITYLPSEQPPIIPELKRPIVDVKCEDTSGRIFVVEMQMEWSAAFSKRILYTVSQAYVQQLNKGQDYTALCPVYGLALLNENCDPGTEWYHHYRLQNVQFTNKALEGVEIVLLELQKFQPRSWEEKRLGVLWLRFLREITDCVEVPKGFESEPEIMLACELAQESAYSKAELRAYNEYWDAIRIERTLIKDGEARGKAEGLAEGRAEGEAKGRAEGECQKAQEIASKLKATGMSVDQISHITGLPASEI